MGGGRHKPAVVAGDIGLEARGEHGLARAEVLAVRGLRQLEGVARMAAAQDQVQVHPHRDAVVHLTGTKKAHASLCGEGHSEAHRQEGSKRRRAHLEALHQRGRRARQLRHQQLLVGVCLYDVSAAIAVSVSAPAGERQAGRMTGARAVPAP